MSHRICYLPLRLERILLRLADRFAWRNENCAAIWQLALFIVEVEREIGTARLKSMLRRVDHIMKKASK